MKDRLQRVNSVRSTELLTLVLIAAVINNVAIVNKAAAYSDTNADGSINVGGVATPVNFTVLTDRNFNLDDPGSFVNGNAGVGASGQGDYQGKNKSTLNGDLYIDKKGQIHLGGGAAISGATHQDTDDQTTVNTLLSNAWADATSLSNTAAAEMVTSQYVSLKDVKLDKGSSMTITGGPNEKVVLSLQNFQLNNGSTFTLQGTATTSFIVNVAKSFSLDHNSMITLAGVPPANVLFNVLHKDIDINNTSEASGTFLTLNHKFNLDHSSQIVAGRVIAKEVKIQNGAAVVTPIMNN